MTEAGKPVVTLSRVALAAALFVLAAWLFLLGWLVWHTDATEIAWARWLTVLASLEAVAFAAAGAIFGTTVQRQRVATAERRAEKAENEAKVNSTDAANGRALAAVVKARAKKSVIAQSGAERMSVTHDAAEDQLVVVANRLFPD